MPPKKQQSKEQKILNTQIGKLEERIAKSKNNDEIERLQKTLHGLNDKKMELEFSNMSVETIEEPIKLTINERDLTCPICLEETQSVFVKCPNCSKRFHFNCAKTWCDNQAEDKIDDMLYAGYTNHMLRYAMSMGEYQIEEEDEDTGNTNSITEYIYSCPNSSK